MSSGIKIVLTFSIVLNVLLAGMVLGKLSHHYITPAHPVFDVAKELNSLSDEKRKLFDSIMGPAKQKMEADHKQIDHAKEEAVAILTQEPFNKDAYLLKVRKITDLYVEMKCTLAEDVSKLALQFTLEERQVLAGIVSHPPFTLPPGALTADKTANLVK